MQPLDVSIFGPLTAAYWRLVTDVAPHVAAGGIDKPQFGSFYAEARAKVLMSAAAKKAFLDSGITIDPKPSKVINRLPGAVAAHRQSLPPQTQEQDDAEPLPSVAQFDNMLEAYRNAEDDRDARRLKKVVLEAFTQSQTELAAVGLENVVLRAEQERHRAMVRKRVPKVLDGDRMYLSRERMISHAEAERKLVEKEPEIVRLQERNRRKKGGIATADDDDNDNEDDKEALLKLVDRTTALRTYLDELDDGESLSAIEDDDTSKSAFYDTVPHASTSRVQL